MSSEGAEMTRDRSRAAVTSKMECFVIIVNCFQPLTFFTKHSILVVAAALDPPLMTGISTDIPLTLQKVGKASAGLYLE